MMKHVHFNLEVEFVHDILFTCESAAYGNTSNSGCLASETLSLTHSSLTHRNLDSEELGMGRIWATAEDLGRNSALVLSLYRQILRSLNSPALPLSFAAKLAKKAEGWEVKVLHRDIKSSNVLLDKDMNARLGDFGLATMHHHEQIAHTLQVIGTVGFMAPELIHTGRASTQTDVFSFGVLVLEVVCGRRPNEENKPTLVIWLTRLMERGEECSAIDERLKGRSECNIDEIKRVLHLGLLCTHPDPHVRPCMRQVVKVLEGDNLDANLLDKINSAAGYVGSSGNSIHPTIEDTFSSHCSFTTVCNTEGR
ncbi:unnamed protein product [Sphenostylis stenocarpa]|uniref:Protein kinase domain-containing protein n=1 Tax=Sphenostylis stenocarpa TaxID=92480 RepID=A0AA86W6K3_9FABA|nr:unnamed protein product [Sphenostylis stenocarpa]